MLLIALYSTAKDGWLVQMLNQDDGQITDSHSFVPVQRFYFVTFSSIIPLIRH